MPKIHREDPTQGSHEVPDMPPQENPGGVNEAAAEAAYLRLLKEAPVRNVEMPTEGQQGSNGGNDGNTPQTLGDAISSVEDMTDLQFAMAKLFPSAIDGNSAMVARIDPQVYIPLLHIKSTNDIMMSDPMQPVNVDKIWMDNNVILSIGLDGRGRIDTAELIGAAREEKRAQNMLRIGNV